jgi:hypothetical protein
LFSSCGGSSNSNPVNDWDANGYALILTTKPVDVTGSQDSSNTSDAVHSNVAGKPKALPFMAPRVRTTVAPSKD